jgi:hypothetical protein
MLYTACPVVFRKAECNPYLPQYNWMSKGRRGNEGQDLCPGEVLLLLYRASVPIHTTPYLWNPVLSTPSTRSLSYYIPSETYRPSCASTEGRKEVFELQGQPQPDHNPLGLGLDRHVAVAHSLSRIPSQSTPASKSQLTVSDAKP